MNYYFTFESPWDKVKPIFTKIDYSTRFCGITSDHKRWYCIVNNEPPDMDDVLRKSGFLTSGIKWNSIAPEVIDALDPEVTDKSVTIAGHDDMVPWYIRPVKVKM